jgi:hypothetical protein
MPKDLSHWTWAGCRTLRFGIRYTFECPTFRRLYRLKQHFLARLRLTGLRWPPYSHGYCQALRIGGQDYPARLLQRGFWYCVPLGKVRFPGWFRHFQPLFSPRCVLMNFTGGAVQRNILQVRIASESLKNLLKKVVVTPQTKPGVDRFPRAKPFRQITPRCPCFDFPKHSIEHHPVGFRGSALASIFGWQ